MAMSERIALFDKALNDWIKATTKGKALARALAETSLQHFAEHGDTILCQRFLEAIEAYGKNYVRRAAYLKWLQAHSPITMESGKLKKQEGGKFDPVLLERAMNKPFWEFSPEPEQVVWTFTDVVKALHSSLKRFESKNAHAANDESMKFLDHVKEVIDELSAEKGKPQKAIAA
jgi:hypothetical protein